MADTKGATQSRGARTVAQVEAGTTRTTFRVVTPSGAFVDFPATPLFPAGSEVKLGADEGEVQFVDVTHKDHAGRAEKLLDPKGDGSASRFHPKVLFVSPVAKKYGGVAACPGPETGKECPTKAIVRKWTSDMHQSERCSGCTGKAKKAKAKKGGKNGVPGAIAATPAETPKAE